MKRRSDYEIFAGIGADKVEKTDVLRCQRNYSDNVHVLRDRYELSWKDMKRFVPGLSDGVIHRKLNEGISNTFSDLCAIADGLGIQLFELLEENPRHSRAVETGGISRKGSSLQMGLTMLQEIESEEVLDEILNQI